MFIITQLFFILNMNYPLFILLGTQQDVKIERNIFGRE